MKTRIIAASLMILVQAGFVTSALACDNSDLPEGVTSKCLPSNPNSGSGQSIRKTFATVTKTLEEVLESDAHVQAALSKSDVQYSLNFFKSKIEGPIRVMKITKTDETASVVIIQFRADSKTDLNEIILLSVEDDPRTAAGYRVYSARSYSKLEIGQFDGSFLKK
jgi:hypothetical protein